jgi:hypothetical protein
MHYARITHNSLNYQKPSGAIGKSKSHATFEGLHKFAWDEWLFNNSFCDAKYHYGFIQGFQNSTLKKYKDIYLISYDSNKKRWTLHAKLDEVEHFDASACGIGNHYLKSGLWQTMLKDLNANQQAEANHLLQISFSNIVNVRYQEKHLTRFCEEFSLPLNCRYTRIKEVGNQLKQIIKTAKSI